MQTLVKYYKLFAKNNSQHNFKIPMKPTYAIKCTKIDSIHFENISLRFRVRFLGIFKFSKHLCITLLRNVAQQKLLLKWKKGKNKVMSDENI